MKTKHTIIADGDEWIPKRGELWGDYETVKAYQGLASTNSARNYRCRHQLRTIKHGQKSLVSKADLDRKSGVA